ncbi:MAG: hypothetical protein VKK04_25245 [Synechococcales bacterium]|nr:hypothetical protein [Synechococcales bacterium]
MTSQPPLNSLDTRLHQLAIAAQHHAPKTPQRQAALRQLVGLVLQSGKLYRPRQGEFPGVYDEIYSEALQDLLLFVCQNIERYDPERAAVMTWLNMLMARRFFQEAIPKVLGQTTVRRLNLVDVEQLATAESTESLTDLIAHCLQADPDRQFTTTWVEGCPQASFQAIATRRLAGVAWKAIAAEFDLGTSTVSTFYYRCLKKFSPVLKAYCLGTVSTAADLRTP